MSAKHIIIPAPIRGILQLVKLTKTKLTNKQAVIVGNSHVFADPLEHLLRLSKMKVSVFVKSAVSRYSKLSLLTKKADLLIVAIGCPMLITKDMIKSNSIVIDVGTNRLNNRTVGDVDFKAVKNKVRAITPVPGGVGPMTIACLLQNTYEASLQSYSKSRRR